MKKLLSVVAVREASQKSNPERALKRPRVLLADHHQMLVDALKTVLEPGCEVVGTVNDGRSLLEAASALKPDVIVLAIAMPQLNGLDAARHLRKSVPNAKLIFLTMLEDPDLVREAFQVGASGFVSKQEAAFELTDAIDKVLRGGLYGTPRVAKGQANIARDHAPEPTLRQREVIQLLAEGHPMKVVADILKITRRTVSAHKYDAKELLQLKSDAELIHYAVKQHIITL